MLVRKINVFTLIDELVKYIPEFDALSAGELIPYFVYFYNQNNGQEATPKLIQKCYDDLSLPSYSNISAYLSNKSSGKNAIFIRKKTGYSLIRGHREKLVESLLTKIEVEPTNDLIDLSILENAPYYVKRISQQMNSCYDNCLYDACLVMMRKLFETLIIECYERYGSSSEITDLNNCFYYLSDLIPKYLQSSHWRVSRNFDKYIKNVKKYGDLSAHNRRFIAKKTDIDSFKFDMRQCLQEMLLIIDYSTWNKEQHCV